MQSYYDILGIPHTAGHSEIKAAFRRLAKLYHPDKNPHGKEHFEKIMLAYEVLIDNSRRRQYDLKLKHGRPVHNESRNTTRRKEWTFTEEEMKRRQYYKENYRKEYRQARYKAAPHQTEKKVYNEYKYILFAAPLAVALLMFVINVWDQKSDNLDLPINQKKEERRDLTGEAPYNSYFKSPQYDTASMRSIRFNNPNRYDAVLCLFSTDNKFIRCSYLQSGNGLEMMQLPMDSVVARIVFGKSWNPSRKTSSSVYGMFDSVEGYYIVRHKLDEGTEPIVLDANFLREKRKISEAEFFKKD